MAYISIYLCMATENIHAHIEVTQTNSFINSNMMGIRLSLIWVVMGMAATAQNDSPKPVVDIGGQPLRPGVEYYITPAVTDIGGALTSVERNGSSCPKYVGQESGSPNRLAVSFALFDEKETEVREGKNFKATFSPATTRTCGGSTAWKVGKRDEATQKRLIEIGGDDDDNDGSYFLIDRDERFGGNYIYNLEFCPVETCPICKFECGNFEALLIANGVRLMSLGIDAAPLAVQFERVQYIN